MNNNIYEIFNEQIKKRIFNKITYKNDCWIWLGAVKGKFNKKYKIPIIQIFNKNFNVYRLLYKIYKKDIKDYEYLLSTCTEKFCVNPDHRKIGNSKMTGRKGGSTQKTKRTQCINGHSYTKENTDTQYHHGEKRYYRKCLICFEKRKHIKYR